MLVFLDFRMNSLCFLTSKLSISFFPSRAISSTSTLYSVFMKKQRKLIQKEMRKRRRLEKEIRQMLKHSKKPKPVDELLLDVKSAKNKVERYRENVVLTEDQIDERAIALKVCSFCLISDSFMKDLSAIKLYSSYRSDDLPYQFIQYSAHYWFLNKNYKACCVREKIFINRVENNEFHKSWAYRSYIFKLDYNRSRNELQRIDDKWIRRAINAQRKALRELKLIDPILYQKAVEPVDGPLHIVLHGPSLTPPIDGYQSPDGDYIDTTRTWT
ncbi:CPW-WPC domain protein [Dictyocaulus viviparus]|uniref:Large ribosomal subunit protein mL40 n=1 Tax=Dictyocaulus viviparus TaxID=29172 RepID=A0A0D8YD72_DICVI|nr:CPW-WPC domain protein [Dictyocaulus viviparus]